MSLDTITRFETKVNTDLVTGLSYLLVYESLNEDYEEGSGPYIKFFVEPFSDHIHGEEAGEKGYFEEGVCVFQIFDEKGSGTRDLYTYRDAIRDNFRDAYLYPTGVQEGTIYCYEISQRPPVEVNNRDSYTNWMRLDVLISYKKLYNV